MTEAKRSYFVAVGMIRHRRDIGRCLLLPYGLCDKVSFNMVEMATETVSVNQLRYEGAISSEQKKKNKKKKERKYGDVTR